MTGPEQWDCEARPGEPRIYAASLTDYNAGVLHGAWILVNDDPEVVQARITAMLAASPTTRRYGDVAEEWAIHDYENFGSVALSEWESIERVSDLGRGITEHGPSFAAWWELTEPQNEDWADTETQYRNQYLGEFDYLVDYGEQLLEEIGFDLDQIDVPDSMRPYVTFDTAAWIRDVEIEGGIETAKSERGIYVFQPAE